MGQAILIKAGFCGGNGGSNNSGNNGSGEDSNIAGWQVKTEIFTTNGYFTVPKAKDQEFHVRLFGGGGSTSGYCGGGGGGNMNNDTLILNKAESIQISIGKGGTNNSNGGTTAFGKYLSATGGERGHEEIYTNYTVCRGGNGGTGGGGYADAYYNKVAAGGNGTYGGGGGAYDIYKGNMNYTIKNCVFNKGGLGGIYGGNGYGGAGVINNGTNTMGNVELEFTGDGLQGNSYSYYSTGGGGGYGGRGGPYYGGGGGYGGNGGNGESYISNQTSPAGSTERYTECGGGGGGGYGGDGGDGGKSSTYAATICGGGGGGYGPENYGCGAGYNMSAKAGVVIITYQAPIYSN